MARIENHKYSIEEAFRECFYIIPDYQREYVWTDKEVLQLLEDIGEQIESRTTREYFIGTILVSPTDKKNFYEVIDGQQRLTTFFLLLCALKHLFQGTPQWQMLSGLILTSYADRNGEVCNTLKLEPRYESAGEVMAKLNPYYFDVRHNPPPVQVAEKLYYQPCALCGRRSNDPLCRCASGGYARHGAER